MLLLTHTKGIKTASQQAMTDVQIAMANLHASHEWDKENGTFDRMFAEMAEDKDGSFAALEASHQASIADGTFDRMFAELNA